MANAITDSTEYSLVEVSGIPCVAWDFVHRVSNTSRQETERRRKQKDALAVQYPDTVMLDTKSTSGWTVASSGSVLGFF